MVIAAILLGAVVVFVLRALRRRRATLAGLNASRPQFMVEPPSRRLHRPDGF